MTNQQSKELLEFIRQLSKSDLVIQTFLKVAEVEARIEMVGNKVDQDFIDDMIVANGMKSLLVSIISMQSNRIKAISSDLETARALGANF